MGGIKDRRSPLSCIIILHLGGGGGRKCIDAVWGLVWPVGGGGWWVPHTPGGALFATRRAGTVCYKLLVLECERRK